jgi:hypothetical protein
VNSLEKICVEVFRHEWVISQTSNTCADLLILERDDNQNRIGAVCLLKVGQLENSVLMAGRLWLTAL